MPTARRKVRPATTQEELDAKWGDIVKGKPYFPLHQAQADVLASEARYTAAIAGSGGGKSVLIALWMWLQVQKHPKSSFLIVVPTYAQIEKTELVERLKLVLSGVYNGQRHIYKLKTGGQIFICQATKPESIEGAHVDAIAVDEAKDVSAKAWKFIKSRSGSKGAPFLITTTLDYNNWVHKEIFSQCDKTIKRDDGWERESSDGAYYVRQWGSSSNPNYDKVFLEQERGRLSDAEFGRRYLGEVTQLDGLIYEAMPDHTIDVDRLSPDQLTTKLAADFKLHPAIRACAGIDFGFDPDPCAVVVGVEAQDGVIYIVEEIYENRLSYDELAKKCRELQNKWGIEKFYCDSSGKAAIHELLRRGIPAGKRTIPQIDVGITMTNGRLRTGLLKVYSCCENLIDEASRYVRPQDARGDLKEKPIDKDNHALDALRYLCTGFDYGRSLPSAPMQLEMTDEQQAQTQLDRQIFLGQVPADAEERRIKAEQQARVEHSRWFQEMMYAGLDD